MPVDTSEDISEQMTSSAYVMEFPGPQIYT